MKRVGALVIPTLMEEKRALLAFVEQRLACEFNRQISLPIGVVRGGNLVCVVVYHEYRHPTIEISIAASSPRWATRPVVSALLGHPFRAYGVNRITSMVEKGNKRSVRFTEGVGFKREGVIRKASKNGKNIIIYGILREEYEAKYQSERLSHDLAA